MPKPGTLNVAAELDRSVVNGPGTRYIIWVQGCPFRCQGCYNQAFLPFVENKPVPIEALAARILSTTGIEGVTYSGGEPMMQARALCQLSVILKGAGLTVVSYTGFTLEELQRLRNPYIGKLLGVVDILIDGRYEEPQKANLLWRGSSNQRVHFLTGAYTHYRQRADARHSEMEMVIGQQGMTSTGILQQDILRKVEGKLRDEP